MQTNVILQGDVLDRLKELPDNSIDCVMTSPPYWALRDYKTAGQLGSEPTFTEYIDKMLEIFDEIKRVLKPTGACWVNLGDTYSMKKKGTIQTKTLLGIPDRFKIAMIDRGWVCRNDIIWYKRNAMPQSAKDRFTVDYEHVFFFTKSQKYYFETQYRPYAESTIPRMLRGVGENHKNINGAPGQSPHTFNKPRVNTGIKFGGNKANGYGPATYSGKEWQPTMAGGGSTLEYRRENGITGNTMVGDQHGSLMRSVWDVTTRGFKGAHFATFPEKLVQTPLKATCPKEVCKQCGKPRMPIYKPTEEYAKLLGKGWHDHQNDGEQGQMQEKQLPSAKADYRIIEYTKCDCNAGFEPGIICDPFMGAGTVAVVAIKNNRRWLGIELNPDYVKMAMDRINGIISKPNYTGRPNTGDNDKEPYKQNNPHRMRLKGKIIEQYYEGTAP